LETNTPGSVKSLHAITQDENASALFNPFVIPSEVGMFLPADEESLFDVNTAVL
jgi:hypothetical protein